MSERKAISGQRSAISQKKTTAMVVAAGMRSEEKAAEGMAVSGQRSVISTEAARMLETGLTAESHIAKLEREAIPYILVAGAAFHLAKAKMEHGQFEQTIKNQTPLALRTVYMRMAAVDNALARLGFDREDRAYEIIVFSSKIAKLHDRAVLETKFAKSLTSALNDAFAGKTGHQLELELGIRAPKKLPAHLRPPVVDEDPAVVASRQIREALQKFEEGLAMLQHHAAELDDKDRAEIGYHCANHLAHMLPDGWKFHIHTHTGHELTIAQVFAEHLGLPEES